jgi:hypothetical protein
MASAKQEQLTAQFYAWELLGRGWLLSPDPIQLEPPFTPFFRHHLPQVPFIDDGVRHTVLSGLVSLFKKPRQLSEAPDMPEVSYLPFLFDDTTALSVIQLILPTQFKSGPQQTEQFLIMLSYCTRPVSFEIIGTAQSIVIQFRCREDDAGYIKSQLLTFFPGLSVREDSSVDILVDELAIGIVDYGLQEEFMRPLAQSKMGSSDLFMGIFSLLEHLDESERVVIQVLFNGVVNYWESSIISSVSDAKGGAFFEDAPEMLPMAKEKISTTLFAATIRIMTQAPTVPEALNLMQKLSFAYTINSRSSGNSLVPLSNQEYAIQDRIDDICWCESHRFGMLLNVKELATFVHIPDSSLISKKVTGDTRKTKPAPQITEGHTFSIGTNSHQGIEKPVTISSEHRLKHTHIIGATGTGKSTLLLSMIRQDIEYGNGVAVIDPHGDLIEQILCVIPEERIHDVLLIDPSDSEYPAGFNILKAHSDIEKEVLSSDLVSAFRKLSTSWGDQMNSVFGNAILAFLESSREGTLTDMRRFLIEKPYRDEFLTTVKDPNIIYYWQKEYPLLKTSSIGPILTRLDTFLRPRLIRNMVAQKKGIDFEAILNRKKIVLVKLSQGLIGAENSFLLGSFVVSKIHQAALARQATQMRHDFFLYIDEFQHFITPSMSHILAGARKYHVGLILAHQDIQQIQKQDSELLHSLIANAGTRICFRLGDADAKRVAEGFSFFDASDFQNLHTGEAIARVERQDYDFSLSTHPFESTEIPYAPKEIILASSRQTYSTSKQEVEDALYEPMATESLEPTKERQAQKQPVKTAIPIEKKAEQIKPVLRPVPESDLDNRAVIEKKEETQHRYLQTLIKKYAEARGYKASIEMLTPDGKGSVDVSLERDTHRIAIEVSVTTEATWELHNIEKCITAGYDAVFVCSTEAKTRKELSQKVQEAYTSPVIDRIKIVEPDELLRLLDASMEKQAVAETTMKGYRINVQYEDLGNDAMQQKRQAISKLIFDAMKKKKK